MFEPKRILIIGGKKKIVQKAKTLGLEVLYIQKKEQFDDSFKAYTDQVFLVDYEDPTILLPLAKALYQAFPFGYAISLTEPGLIPAAMINDALGLLGNSLEVVTLLKDKWAMRQRLNELGISPVAARPGKTEADLKAFSAEYGLPMIVKPVDGSASEHIFCVKEQTELATVWREIQQAGLSAFLMEQYLEGPEISVEAFSFSGRHVILAMTDKLIEQRFVEIGHSIPAQLGVVLQEEVAATVMAFLDAMGLKEGPSHTELKLTRYGPRVVESHNRIGGDKINELVRLVYGVDMDTLALAWPFRLVPAISTPPAPRVGAAIRFFNPPPGVVREIYGLAELHYHPQVVEHELTAQVGSLISSLGNSHDRCGYLIATGENAREAIATCERLLEQVRILTEPVAGEAIEPVQSIAYILK